MNYLFMLRIINNMGYTNIHEDWDISTAQHTFDWRIYIYIFSVSRSDEVVSIHNFAGIYNCTSTDAESKWSALECDWMSVCVCVWVCVHNQSGRNGRIAQDLLANRLKYDPSCCCCCRWNIVSDYIFIFVVFDVRTCYGTMAFHVWMGAAHTCNRPITCHHQRLLEDGVSQPKQQHQQNITI